MKNIKVSIVIPNFNGRDLVLENLPKVVKEADKKANKIVEIIVVDDGSTDNSVDVINDNFPEVKLLEHKENKGFSAAVNTGAKAAKGNLICLLNNDVYPEEKFLKASFKHFKDDDVFAVSFHTKEHAWVKGDFKDGYIVYEEGEELDEPRETFFANAGGAIYKSKIWKKMNGMDDDLLSPFYWEDVDISYRALKRGYKIMWEPDTYVSPNLTATIGKMPKKKVQRIQERNHLLFVWKNLTSQNLFRKHLTALFKRLAKSPGYFVILFMALSRLPEAFRARKKERKESKVSDEAIFQRFK